MPVLPLMLLLLPHTADAARKKKKHDDVAQRTPAAVLPSPTAKVPYPPPTPQLAGPTGVLALQGLTRDEVSFRFETDLSGLGSLDNEVVNAIFAQLSADPRWRVSRGADGRAAVLRTGTGDPAIGPGGWHVDKEDCFRVALHEGSARSGPWADSERVTRIPSEQRTMDLEGFRPDGGLCARLATALRVVGAISLEIFEAGSPDERPVTIQAVGELPSTLINMKYAVRTIERDGYDPLALPDGEPRPMFGPSVHVEGQDGQLSIRARINPHAPGWTWVRILDAAGQPWEEAAVTLGTLERVGWSYDEAYGFYLQGAFAVPAGGPFDGSVEVWFQPDEPGEPANEPQPGPQRLHDEDVTIPSR